MKKILTLVTLFFVFFTATPATAKAKLDSEGKNYWTIEFKKSEKTIHRFFNNIRLRLVTSRETRITGKLKLKPGTTGTLLRKDNFYIIAFLRYDELRDNLGLWLLKKPITNIAVEAYFNTKNHYTIVNTAKNSRTLWGPVIPPHRH